MSTDPITGHAAGLLPAQVQTLDSAISALPTDTLQRERQARVESGLDTTAFDRALAAKQVQPLNPADARTREHLGIASETQPPAYNFNLSGLPPTEGRVDEVRSELRNWSLQLGMDGPTGSAIGSRLAAVGGMLRGMTPEQRSAWSARSEEINLRLAGSPAALAEIRKDVEQLLKRSPNSDISKGLLGGDMVSLDPELLNSLRFHAMSLKLYETRQKK